MSVDVVDPGVVTAVRAEQVVERVAQQHAEQETAIAVPNPNRIFVDSSGRRARWVGRAGYLFGIGCATYVGMVALGLSGTRVAPMAAIPDTGDTRIIAGLSGQTGSMGLQLTQTPAAPPAATVVTVRHTFTPVRRPAVPVKVAQTTPAKPATVPTTKQTTGPTTKPSKDSKPTKDSKDSKGTKDSKGKATTPESATDLEKAE